MRPNKYFVITTIYIFLILFFSFALSIGVRRIPDVGQPEENRQLWIYSDHSLVKTFTPQNNGLNMITVYLKNVSLRNQDPFLFELSDGTGVLRTMDITGYNIVDGDHVRFQFAPILNSKDLELTLTLTSPSSQEMAIGVGYSDKAEDITFQTYYYPTKRTETLVSALSSYLATISQFRLIVTMLFLGLAGYFAIDRLTGRLNLLQDL